VDIFAGVQQKGIEYPVAKALLAFAQGIYLSLTISIGQRNRLFQQQALCFYKVLTARAGTLA